MAKLKSLRQVGTRAIRKLLGQKPSPVATDATPSSDFDEQNIGSDNVSNSDTNPNNNNNDKRNGNSNSIENFANEVVDNSDRSNSNTDAANHSNPAKSSSKTTPPLNHTSAPAHHPSLNSLPNSYSISPESAQSAVSPKGDIETNMAMRSILNTQPRGQSRQPVQETEKTVQPFPSPDSDKENLPPVPAISDVETLTTHLGKVELNNEARSSIERQSLDLHIAADEDEPYDEEQVKHLSFIQEALDMARLALKINETPVGCVLVHNDKIVARGMNATNVTRNGTRHAEFMAISALLSYPPKNGPRTTSLKPKIEQKVGQEADDDASIASPQPDEGNEDGSKGHLYPYGQKDHPDERVGRGIIRECTLYVTVEPCVMCASLLRQLGIKKVYFGAVNDKFGGTGGVFSIHANSLPVRDDGQTASAHPQPPPMRLPGGGQVLGTSFPPGGGDGGNIESGYEIEGGWGRDEAVALLRRFYVQENGRAPVPRKKEGRAARLAAMMENDAASEISGSASGGTITDGDDLMNFPPETMNEKGQSFDCERDHSLNISHTAD